MTLRHRCLVQCGQMKGGDKASLGCGANAESLWGEGLKCNGTISEADLCSALHLKLHNEEHLLSGF